MLCVVLLVLGLVYYSEADIQMSGSTMIFKRVKTMTFSSDINLKHFPGRMVAYHQWNQVYNDKTDHFITKLGELKAEKSEFIIDVEKFDNNTEIYNLFKVYNASNGNQLVLNLTLYGSGVERRFIHLVDDGYYEGNGEILKQEYYVKKQVLFSCQEYSPLSYNVQIGWINSVGDKIFFYKGVEIALTPLAEHNGSILCCIHYTVTINENGMSIRRFVKKKTLLIHQEEMSDKDEPSNSTTKNYCEKGDGPETPRIVSPKINERNSIATEEVNKTSNTAKEPGKSSNETGKNFNDTPRKETGKYTNAPNESSKNSNATEEKTKNFNATHELDKNLNATNETDTNSEATNITKSSSDKDLVPSHNLTIVISAISVSVLILLVMIYAIYKRCRREVDRRDRSLRPLPPVPRQRSSTEPDPNSPFYSNFLFRRECQLEIQAREEPQYEEIMYQ